MIGSRLTAKRILVWQNPLLSAELRRRLRKGSTFILLLIPVGLIIGLFYFWYQIRILSMGAFGQTSSSAELGREMFEWLVFLYLLVGIFAIPAVTAGSVCREREQGTFEMLRLSRLTSWNIVSGKMLAAMSFLGLILLSPLPIIFYVRLFGGFSEAEILTATVITFAWTCTFGFLSLLISSMTRRTRTALIVSYGTIASWLWLSHSVVAYFPWFQFRDQVRFLTNPMAAITTTFRTFGLGTTGMDYLGFGPHAWLYSVASALLLSLLFGLLSLFLIRHPLTLPEGAGRKARQRRGSRATLVGPRHQPLGDRLNTIFQREVRTSRLGTWKTISLFVVGGLLLVLLPMVIDQMITGDVGWSLGVNYMFLSVGSLLILASGCVIGSLSLIVERENGTLQSLRMTELEPHTIVGGKFWSSYLLAMLLSILVVPTGIYVTLYQYFSIHRPEVADAVDILLFVMAYCAAFAAVAGVGTALGVNASVNARKATSAVVSAIIFLLIWGLIVLIGSGFLMMFLMLFFTLVALLVTEYLGFEFLQTLPYMDTLAEYFFAGFPTLVCIVAAVLTIIASLRAATADLALRMGRESRRAARRRKKLAARKSPAAIDPEAPDPLDKTLQQPETELPHA